MDALAAGELGVGRLASQLMLALLAKLGSLCPRGRALVTAITTDS